MDRVYLLVLSLLSKPSTWILLLGLIASAGLEFDDNTVQMISMIGATIADVLKGFVGR